jgi:hypothetical protein
MSLLGSPGATADYASTAALFLPHVWKEAKSLFFQEYPLETALLKIVLGAAVMHVHSISHISFVLQSTAAELF